MAIQFIIPRSLRFKFHTSYPRIYTFNSDMLKCLKICIFLFMKCNVYPLTLMTYFTIQIVKQSFYPIDPISSITLSTNLL